MERRIIKNYELQITNYGLWERSGHPAYSRDELQLQNMGAAYIQISC